MKFSTSLFTVMVIMRLVGYCFGADTEVLNASRVVQRVAARDMVNAVMKHDYTATHEAARTVMVGQKIELSEFDLSEKRATEPQRLTKGAFEAALSKATALGVSGNLVSAAKVQWSTATTIDAAEAAIGSIQTSCEAEERRVAGMGSLRRMLPAWAGGTTAFAATTVPQQQAPTAVATTSSSTRVELFGWVLRK